MQQPLYHLLVSYGSFWGSLCRWPTAKTIKFWLTTGIWRMQPWMAQTKNIKFWHTTGIRRGPYLCSLHAWAVQKPPYHLRWLTAKNIKLWLTTGIRRGPPTYVDYMLGQCSSHHTIYFCLLGTSGAAYAAQDGSQPKISKFG